MTRCVFGFLCVCALGVVPMVGCSGSEGTGGSGGSAGSGGAAGSGGSAGTGGAAGSGGAGGMVGEACVPSEWECISSEIDPIEEMCAIFVPDQPSACDGTESLTNPTNCTATGNTVTHQLTKMQIASDCNTGFDLDGCDGRSCEIRGLAPAEGANGVDNALGGIGIVLERMGWGNLDILDQLFHDAICTGVIDIEIEVDSVPAERCAVVTVSAAGVQGDPIPMNLSDDGCLSGTLGTLPISLGDVQGAIENAVVRMTVSSAGFSDGILGGTADETTAGAMFEEIIDGGSAIVGQFFDINADLSGNSMLACNSLSLTLEIGGDAICPPQIDCNDGDVCTKDVCNPVDGTCDHPPAEDGTWCTEGWCIAGGCEPIGAVAPCNELGLRAAIHNGGGPYAFDCDGPTTVVIDSEIVIDNDVMLDAGGNLTVEGGGDPPHLFSVIAGVTAELRGFAIQGGSSGHGAGIFNEGILTIADCTVSGTDGIENAGVLTMSNSVVSDNRPGVSNTGTMTMIDVVVSGNGAGAGIVNEGTLTLTNTTVSDHPGGGIANFGGTLTLTSSTVSGNSADQGGGIYNALGTLTLTNTLVSGNSARQGGGIYQRFGPETLADSTVTDSTVTENTATSSGGGIHVIGLGATLALTNTTVSRNVAESKGGGILTTARTSLQNCTVSGNSAPRGGGMTAFFADVYLVNSTVSGNVAEEGSAILHSRSAGSVRLTATIVEGECASSPAGAGGTSSNGYNIESPGDTCGFDQPTDQVNVTAEDLKLGPLADNGGSTETHALLPGSVAIDAIPEAMCEVSTDQRGEPRPEAGGSMCDVGSFEVQDRGQ